MAGTDIGKVLAVRGGALGDFVLALPAVQALQRSGAEVQLLTRPAYGRLAEAAGLVAGWRSLEGPEASSFMTCGAELSQEWLAWLAEFDAVVSWLPDRDGVFQQQVRRAGVERFWQGDWSCSGAGPAALQLAAALPEAIRRMVSLNDPVFAPAGGAGKWIGFHPGSGSVRKNWPLPQWGRVLAAVQEVHPELEWRIFTGEAEEERLPEIAELLTSAGLSWENAHGLPLTDLLKSLQQCRLFLGHDSGTSHLAAAGGVPCRLLFGPTDASVWRPAGEGPDMNVNVLEAPCGAWEALTPETVKAWLSVDFPGLSAAGRKS